mmetsp:Transcript_447/g.1037  ORF Transcript_447/g.1037 Transcript_447/m.1037 type:complete len:239 (+) Transcript_447:210-926(+)
MFFQSSLVRELLIRMAVIIVIITTVFLVYHGSIQILADVFQTGCFALGLVHAQGSLQRAIILACVDLGRWFGNCKTIVVHLVGVNTRTGRDCFPRHFFLLVGLFGHERNLARFLCLENLVTLRRLLGICGKFISQVGLNKRTTKNFFLMCVVLIVILLVLGGCNAFLGNLEMRSLQFSIIGMLEPGIVFSRYFCLGCHESRLVHRILYWLFVVGGIFNVLVRGWIGCNTGSMRIQQLW